MAEREVEPLLKESYKDAVDEAILAELENIKNAGKKPKKGKKKGKKKKKGGKKKKVKMPKKMHQKRL